MKLKITPQLKCAMSVTSSLTPREFLREARHRFPSPSPFLDEFLRRYEDMLNKTNTAQDTIAKVQQHSEELACPCCGIPLMVECGELVETEE